MRPWPIANACFLLASALGVSAYKWASSPAISSDPPASLSPLAPPALAAPPDPAASPSPAASPDPAASPPQPSAPPSKSEARGSLPPDIEEGAARPFAATKAQWFDFLTRVGAQRGIATSADELERAFLTPAAGPPPSPPTPWDTFCARFGFAPGDPLDHLCWNGTGHLLALDVADVDNDGRDDYLLVATNVVGSHNDWAVGLFTPKGSGLERRAFEGLEAFEPASITHFDRPFLRREPEGVTFTLWHVELFDKDGGALGFGPLEAEKAVRRRDTYERWVLQRGHMKNLDSRVEDENYLTGRKRQYKLPGR